jgi:acyl carrier protein
MIQNNFNIEEFKATIADLFEVNVSDLNGEYDLSVLIKDSIDLGELVAILKSRYGVDPKNWESFKVETKLQEVFANFE